MNKKSIVAGLLISAALALPFAASALSVDDIQQQIKDLLARVAVLQAQLSVQGQASSSPAQIGQAAPAQPAYCAVLNRNLSRGERGDDVRALQEFLSGAGFLNASATGYFGSATASAVARWQSSEGVQALGIVGPRSLARLKLRCGGLNSNFSADQTSGTAPLTVTFTTSVSINDAIPSVDFGDGSSAVMTKGSCVGITAIIGGQGGIRCGATVSHTYTQNGSYSARLINTSVPASGTILIQVGTSLNDRGGTLSAAPQSGSAPLNVSFTFRPNSDDANQGQYWIEYGDGNGQIMDFHQIYCFRAPCISPSVASHTYSAPGSYTAVVSPYIACAHTGEIRCMIATFPLAQTTVTVTGASSATAPSITGFSGPTSLSVNQQGTWSVTATDPLSGNLSYSISWGDEQPTAGNALMMAPAATSQNTTFTHAYAAAGDYTVTMTVRNASGLSAQSTATVHVTAAGGSGAPCGGNTANPPQCSAGYTCQPIPGSNLPFGDVGGRCVAN